MPNSELYPVYVHVILLPDVAQFHPQFSSPIGQFKTDQLLSPRSPLMTTNRIATKTFCHVINRKLPSSFSVSDQVPIRHRCFERPCSLGMMGSSKPYRENGLGWREKVLAWGGPGSAGPSSSPILLFCFKLRLTRQSRAKNQVPPPTKRTTHPSCSSTLTYPPYPLCCSGANHPYHDA